MTSENMAVMWRCLHVSTCLAWSSSYRTASCDGQDTWQEWTYATGCRVSSSGMGERRVTPTRPRVLLWTRPARELKSIGFNLDDRAIRMGVSPNWIDVAQRRDAWRGLVEPLLLMAEAKPISSQSSSAGDEICSTRHEKDVMIGSRLQSLSATWSMTVCGPEGRRGLQYNTIQYNTIQYNTIDT